MEDRCNARARRALTFFSQKFQFGLVWFARMDGWDGWMEITRNECVLHRSIDDSVSVEKVEG